jgi:hypothetical protein
MAANQIGLQGLQFFPGYDRRAQGSKARIHPIHHIPALYPRHQGLPVGHDTLLAVRIEGDARLSIGQGVPIAKRPSVL